MGYLGLRDLCDVYLAVFPSQQSGDFFCRFRNIPGCLLRDVVRCDVLGGEGRPVRFESTLSKRSHDLAVGEVL